MKSIDCMHFTLGPMMVVSALTVGTLWMAARITSEHLCGKWMQRKRDSTDASGSAASAFGWSGSSPRSPRQMSVVSRLSASISAGVNPFSSTK